MSREWAECTSPWFWQTGTQLLSISEPHLHLHTILLLLSAPMTTVSPTTVCEEDQPHIIDEEIEALDGGKGRHC